MTLDIKTLRALVDAATPGPWKPSVWIETDGDEWRATGPGHDQHAHDYGSEPGGPDEQAAQRDAAFICAARSALPALLDRLAEVERERDEALQRRDDYDAALVEQCRAARDAIRERDTARAEAERLAKERERYAWALPETNVTRPSGCRCDLWPRGYCREGCPSGDTTRDRLASECEALRRERDVYKALAANAEHWADCATNHGGTECDMGPECGLRPETRAELLALIADRDRLRKLLGEAVEIARTLGDQAEANADRDDDGWMSQYVNISTRLAAIAKEGLT